MPNNLRFSCTCGGQFTTIINSRNRAGSYRIRRYKCSNCDIQISTIEVPIETDLRGRNGLGILKEEILESATGLELLEALRWKIQD